MGRPWRIDGESSTVIAGMKDRRSKIEDVNHHQGVKAMFREKMWNGMGVQYSLDLDLREKLEGEIEELAN